MPEIPNDISEVFEADQLRFQHIADFDQYKERIGELLQALHGVSNEFANAIKDAVWGTCPADELIGRDLITMMIGVEPEITFQVVVAADKAIDAWMVTITHGEPPDSE